MSPVWRPAIDPPCLDKFCHLSHDAQRVMVAIFEDFNDRKRELLQCRTRQENTVQDASDYYRAKYEARFGPMYRTQTQPSTQPSEQRHTHGPVRRDSTTINGHYASVDNLYQARDQNLQYSSNSDRILDGMWGEDTSTYSDSPPIETQGYRFLSQLTRNEAKLDQNNESLSLDNSIQTEENTLSNFGIQPNLNYVSASRSATGTGYEPCCEPEKGFKQNNTNVLQMGNRTLVTGYEILKGNFNDNADDSTGIASFHLDTDLDIPDSTRTNGTCMYTAEKFVGEKEHPDVTVAETSSYSQSLFSQDSLTGQIITPNKKRLHKTKACVMKRKRFEKPELNSNTYGNEQHSGHSSHFSGSGRENFEEIMNIAKPQALNRKYDTSDSDKMDRTKQTRALVKDKDSVSMNICSLQHGINGESYAVSSNLTDLNTEKTSRVHAPTFQTKGLEKSVESMHLDEESPFLYSDLKLKQSDTQTPGRNRPEVICDESPFGPNNAAGRDVYDIFKISSKKDSGSLTKRPSQPGTESIHGSTKKRPSASKGFAVPTKKVKTNITEGKIQDISRSACQVTDVSATSQFDQEQIISKLLESSEVIISLVYESWATQLRESVFSQEPKKRGVSKKNLDKLRGVVCSSRSIPREVFLFPIVPTGDTFYQTSRSFLLKLLKGETRKVGVHVQRTFLEILKYIGGDTSKDSRWTILDPIVAMWLLDPDNPVNNFEEILTKVGMPPMAPSNCCQDMIYEDMMLLRVAMERLYKQLQAKELWDLFICVEMKLTPLLAMLEMTPLSVATHTLMQFSEILKKKCTKLEKEAHEAAGHAFLLTSPSQLRQVLFEELQLDTKLQSKSRLARTSVGRETSTSESVLTQLSPFHPLPGIILEYRQVQKLKSTYIDGILSCVENDHLRTNWDQTAAATGRLTAYQPNVQAIPKIPVTITRYKENYIAGRKSDESIDIYARDAFVSQPGWTLLSADFQQIELRLLAQLADDPILLKLFNDKEVPDIFNALTAQWLGKSIEAISTVEREQTKRVVYSIMYGVGKEKLAEHLKMSVDQAKAIMASFLVKFPAVKQFTQTCVEFCQKNGYCCSIFKRRRLIPNIRHSSPALRAQAERQAVNFCIQGSAADICKAAMIQIVHALSVREDVSARLLMQIHDELLLEVLDSDLEHVTALVKDVMESSDKLCGSVIKLNVPLPVSLSTGKTWGHMTAVESKQNTGTL